MLSASEIRFAGRSTGLLGPRDGKYGEEECRERKEIAQPRIQRQPRTGRKQDGDRRSGIMQKQPARWTLLNGSDDAVRAALALHPAPGRHCVFAALGHPRFQASSERVEDAVPWPAYGALGEGLGAGVFAHRRPRQGP